VGGWVVNWLVNWWVVELVGGGWWWVGELGG
jgi:hypothetical protein